ncbi:12550_t:CDS:2, partial [Acaulospora morrowiae]
MKHFLFFLLLIILLASGIDSFSTNEKHPKKCVGNKIGTITRQPNIKVPDDIAVPANNKFAYALYLAGSLNWTCAAYPNGTAFWNN